MIEVKKLQRADHTEIQVKGEVDASSSIELDNALQSSLDESKKIIVDLENLEYISSAGLGVFISYLEEIKSKEIKLVLCNMKPKVYDVFKILGLENLMEIVNTKEEAEQALNEA
ncbi:STAS domain-containing protein [Marinoscillum sp. MHG1-6]|uniref:STAS domain-containing protein n=1 Tax=Marinoscillum sp. MHG1-6 TaxID=2959627 RepID=UPI0021581657|nr:STAS domain-containing protein [Marinoscillum sp. MHG1-6]